VRLSILIAAFLSLAAVGFFFFGFYATDHFTGSVKTEQRFDVRPNEDVLTLGKRLEENGIIFSRYTFFWYLFHEEKTRQIVAGQYMLSGNLTVPEIALMLTTGKTISRDIRVTFPEGWTIQKMSERLTANSLPGEEFLVLAKEPLDSWRQQFDFLGDLPKNASLEGYLFPDTYFFAPEAKAEDIIVSMLKNFGKKYDATLRAGVAASGHSLFSIVTLASIIEEEGRTAEERDMISDIFWKRLSIGQPLQSDATINYIHGTTRLQPTLKDTEVESPYNTYRNQGLPPGPISNPSLMSLHASIFPKSNPYFYFLVDLNTGETFFAKTFEEHVRNRTLHGL
jgi:UPF0755 protein